MFYRYLVLLPFVFRCWCCCLILSKCVGAVVCWCSWLVRVVRVVRVLLVVVLVAIGCNGCVCRLLPLRCCCLLFGVCCLLLLCFVIAANVCRVLLLCRCGLLWLFVFCLLSLSSLSLVVGGCLFVGVVRVVVVVCPRCQLLVAVAARCCGLFVVVV